MGSGKWESMRESKGARCNGTERKYSNSKESTTNLPAHKRTPEGCQMVRRQEVSVRMVFHPYMCCLVHSVYSIGIL